MAPMTLLHTLRPDGTYTSEDYTGRLDHACVPFAELKRRLTAADPIHKGCFIEHVNVYWNGGRAHMFVDEDVTFKEVRRNERATRIYYNASLQRLGRDDLLFTELAAEPHPLPIGIEQPGFNIAGVALLWEGDME
jgi:hypothetical protein